MRRIVAILLIFAFVAALNAAWQSPDPQAPTQLGSAPEPPAGPPQSPTGEPDRRPNILIIMSDDQRASGTLQVMKKLRKRLIGEGVRYTHAYATTPQCCPSRASIMTGQYAHNHDVGNNEEGGNFDHSTSVQRHLAEAGYLTGLVGKYLVGWSVFAIPPNFHDYSLFEQGYYDTLWNINGNIRPIEEYSTRFIASRGQRFIERAERDDDRPWYLFVTPWAPHEASIPEPKYEDRPVGRFRKNAAVREKDCSDKPEIVTCSGVMRWASRQRRDMLRTLFSVDDLVGRLLRTIRERGERRRTLVFFLSDNGYLLGEHGLIGKKPPYRGGIEIPMAMSWPGRVAPGTTDRRLAANIDLAPTIYDAAGITPPTVTDGRSLLDPEWRRRRLLLEYKEYKGWPDWASTITKKYQYTEYYDQNGMTSFRELYRLDEDPWQLVNVLHDRDRSNDPPAEELARLQARLAADRTCTGEACP